MDNLSIKCFFAAACLIVLGMRCPAQIASPGWLNAIGTGGGFYENGGGIRAGSNSQIYMSGRYAGAINLNGASPANATGATDCFAAQLSPNLVGTWATKVHNSGGYDYVYGFNIDPSNNTYTVGTSNSGAAFYVTRTNSAGAVTGGPWNFGTNGGANGVCADAAGNIYVCANIGASQTIGSSSLAYQGGGSDLLIMKLSSAGAVLWTALYGGGGYEAGRAIEFDANGNLWVCGGYTGAPNFGSFAAPASAAYSSLFVAEFNPANGACMNLFTATNAGIVSGGWYEENDLRVDSCNNIYVAGHFQGTANFGGMTRTSNGNDDFFVAKINPAGLFQWVQTGGGTVSDQGQAITLDKNWDVIVGGYFNGTATFGSTSITATGNNDVFVAKYASGNGALMFVQKGGGQGYEDVYGGITADANRQIYLTGGYSDNNVAANTTVFGANNLGNGYYGNIYVAKLDSTPNLRIVPQTSSPYCAGGCYTLPFLISGTFNPGNVFTAELSSATGNFASGTTVLGNVTTNAAGNITICFPSNLATGTYLIRVTSSSPSYSSVVGCSSVISVSNSVITIGAPPTVSVAPSSASICTGSNVTLTASGSSTYSWLPNSGLNTTSGATVIASPTVSTTYTVTGTSVSGCTDTATVTVNVNNTLVASVSGNITICNGSSTTLTASGGVNYSWSSGGTSASETLSPSSTTTYSVVASDPVSGCSDTASVTVTVNLPPVVSISGNTSVCAGDSTTLTASGGGNYQWSSGGTSANETVSPAATTSYTVVVTDALTACTDSASVTVTVNPLPVITIAGTTSVCSGGSTTLTASGGGNYQWSTGGTSAGETVSPAGSTTYTVVVTDGTTGCQDSSSVTVTVNALPVVSITGNTTICAGANTTLTASGGGNYQWSSGGTSAGETVSPLANTTYTVVVTDPTTTCSDSATVSVTVNSAPVAAITGNTTLCSGASTTLTAAGGGTYAWSTSATSSAITVTPAATTNYSVIVTNAANCSDTASVSVTVNPLPNAAISGTTTLCNGQSTTLSAAGSGNYLWSNGSTSSSITVSPASNTSYTLVVTDPATGCSDSSSVQVNVLLPPTASITGTNVVCAGGSVQLTAAGGGTYTWSTGQTSAGINPIPSATTTYSVVVSNGACTDTAYYTVTVNPLPSLAISQDTTITYGQSATIYAFVQSGVSVTWSPSAGLDCSNCTSPAASPAATTTYCVYATDSNGCADSACMTVYVDITCGEVFVPNAFSPNNDGSNDVLFVYGNCVTSMNFQVFDRWGEKVFESNDPATGWDGTYRGKEMDEGTFVYQLQATLVNGDVRQLKGSISLIR
jgi:gliding motility-associated-like protein